MNGDLSQRLRRKLTAYLSGKTSLTDFRHWFIPASWDVAKWAPPELAALVYRIELSLIEHENGHRTEDDLRQALAAAVASYEAEARRPTGPTSDSPTSAAG
jgi:hypothetical protein